MQVFLKKKKQKQIKNKQTSKKKKKKTQTHIHTHTQKKKKKKKKKKLPIQGVLVCVKSQCLRKPIGDISLELKRFWTLKLLKHLDDTQDLKILET